MKAGEAFVWLDRYLDTARTGPLYLKDERIAQIVEKHILTAPCEVHAYVIMANHIHLLVTPRADPSKMMQFIKGASAREINLSRGSTGNFWQRESYDHWVRGPAEWQRIRRYIENNPVAAGHVPTPGQYRWSSAWRTL